MSHISAYCADCDWQDSKDSGALNRVAIHRFDENHTVVVEERTPHGSSKTTLRPWIKVGKR